MDGFWTPTALHDKLPAASHPMRVTLLTYGSRGDVEPFLALALGLKQAGHRVRLAAPARMQEFVESFEIDFAPLPGEPAELSKSLNQAGSSLIGMVRAMMEYVLPVAADVFAQARQASLDADLLVHSFLFTAGGHTLARALGIPDISAQLFPMFAPTSTFPHLAFPNLPLGGTYNRITHHLSSWIFRKGSEMGYRQLRKRSNDLPERLHWPFRETPARARTPLFIAHSAVILPAQPGWGNHVHVTGYWFLPAQESYQPPQALLNFLEAGAPPLCITFGSMIHTATASIYALVLEALKRTEQRGLILTGWGEWAGKELPEHVFVMEAAPHDWLFPQTSAVLHHGGAGTTAAGLKAGVPNIILPFAADQPFWAHRVAALGAGPRPLSIQGLNASQLANAISQAIRDVEMRQNAVRIGEIIQAEDGVRTAVKLAEKHTRTFYGESGSGHK